MSWNILKCIISLLSLNTSNSCWEHTNNNTGNDGRGCLCVCVCVLGWGESGVVSSLCGSILPDCVLSAAQPGGQAVHFIYWIISSESARTQPFYIFGTFHSTFFLPFQVVNFWDGEDQCHYCYVELRATIMYQSDLKEFKFLNGNAFKSINLKSLHFSSVHRVNLCVFIFSLL